MDDDSILNAYDVIHNYVIVHVHSGFVGSLVRWLWIMHYA